MMTMTVTVSMMKSILDLSVAVMRGRIGWKWGHSAVMDRVFLCKFGSEQSQKTLRASVHLSYTVWNNGGWKEKGFGTAPIYGPGLCSADWFRVLFTNFLETTVILCDVREASWGLSKSISRSFLLSKYHQLRLSVTDCSQRQVHFELSKSLSVSSCCMGYFFLICCSLACWLKGSVFQYN